MAIELRGVSKRYPNGAIGAVDVDLVTRPSEFVALFGPSGSGKTSLLQMIGLLLHPDSGEVLIDGERVDDRSEAATAELRRSRLGVAKHGSGCEMRSIRWTWSIVPITDLTSSLEGSSSGSQ